MGQLHIGDLVVAEQSLRRSIEVCLEIEDEFHKAVGRQELGRLLAYCGNFAEAASELDTAQAIFDRRFEKVAKNNFISTVRAYHSLLAFLEGDLTLALSSARDARHKADVVAQQYFPHERDFVLAEWLLGAAHLAMCHPLEAETHLTEALTRCRRINLVELEPDILLEMARLQWAQAQSNEVMSDESTRLQEKALELAREALAIANRCEYRLKQVDIHNFLAQLALERGDREEAREHAEIARERAWCDGPPHCYKPALEEAERILESYGGG